MSGGRRPDEGSLLVGLARAAGGAVFFALPLLMTMEMWWLGFYLPPARLVLFLLATFPLLIGLARYSGFERTTTWLGNTVDAVIAVAVGGAASGALLALMNVIRPGMPLEDIIGAIAIQTVPASIGAVLASSEFGVQREGQGRDPARDSYRWEVFLMAAGAVFLAFNVAPTEEMVLIAYRMTYVHALLLALATLAMMHGFVYGAAFRGRPQTPPGTPFALLFLRFTVVGYALALLISAYVLWTFGRFDDHNAPEYLMITLVLAFPAGLGAAAARLIL